MIGSGVRVEMLTWCVQVGEEEKEQEKDPEPDTADMGEVVEDADKGADKEDDDGDADGVNKKDVFGLPVRPVQHVSVPCVYANPSTEGGLFAMKKVCDVLFGAQVTIAMKRTKNRGSRVD